MNVQPLHTTAMKTRTPLTFFFFLIVRFDYNITTARLLCPRGRYIYRYLKQTKEKTYTLKFELDNKSTERQRIRGTYVLTQNVLLVNPVRLDQNVYFSIGYFY